MWPTKLGVGHQPLDRWLFDRPFQEEEEKYNQLEFGDSFGTAIRKLSEKYNQHEFGNSFGTTVRKLSETLV